MAFGGRQGAVSRVALVLGGYVIAGAIAGALMALYIAVTPGVDRQGSAGMSAFGDSLLFLAVFGVGAVPVTGVAFYFLRPCARFWTAFSLGAAAVAATAIAAVAALAFSSTAGAVPALAVWSVFAPLRILLAPLCAGLFALAAIFAPTRASRKRLVVATIIEAVMFGCGLVMWLRPLMAH